MSYRQNKFLALLMLSLVATLAQASNHTETIDIKARYLLLDEKKGISKYKGNVLFTKGTLIIKADTITLYYDDNKLNKAVITGSPADVQHQPDDEPKIHSQANKMEYFVAEERLFLKGQAFVDQGNRHFSGESIEYDTRQRIITAANNSSSAIDSKNTENSPPKGRVHVIIGPTEEETQAEKIEKE